MSLPAFLRFAPVPVRPRNDGWSPALQRRFVLNLARGMGASEAARSLGRSRQSAYALRSKAGAEGFVQAWDSALEFSREARTAAHQPFGDIGIETLLVPRFYRGRMVGYVQREDVAGAMRRLAKLDRIAERLGPPTWDEPDFAALLDSLDPGPPAEPVEIDANPR